MRGGLYSQTAVSQQPATHCRFPRTRLQYRPTPYNPKKGEVTKKPMKTKALCAAATAVLFALVSAPSAYCAETDAPGADGHSAAPMYLECSPAFQWLCGIFGL